MNITGGPVSAVDLVDRAARDMGFIRDRWYRALDLSSCFAGGANLTPGAGNIGSVQLFNPLASGVIVRTRQIIVSRVSGAGILHVRLGATALTTDNGSLFNMNSGAAVSVARIRTQSSGALLGNESMILNAPDAGSLIVLDQIGYRLNAGQGLHISASVADIVTLAMFIFEETAT